MSKSIFYVFLSLLLVVSCECKDMHFRKLPEEKDIAFEGEVKAAPSQKTKPYVPNERRDIQLHLSSNDKEAKEAKFKILSWEVADGKKGTLDTSSIRLGDNTLAYMPQEPGTHEITLRVAVEGEEASAKIVHYTLEAPAANWQVEGRADEAGNIALTITNAPDEWRSESWRITNTTFSDGLAGRLETTPTELNYGTNNLRINLDRAVLAEPHVQLTIQGPDGSEKDCRINLTALCVAQLSGEMGELDRSLAKVLSAINDEHDQETERLYQLPIEMVTDPRDNRERQTEVEERLNLMERDLETYNRNLQRLEALEVQDPTRPNRQLPTFRRGQQRLKDAIASLKSAQVQLQQQCTTAHEALFKTLTEKKEEEAIILSNDPRLNVNPVVGFNNPHQYILPDRYSGNGYGLLHLAIIPERGYREVVRNLLKNSHQVDIIDAAEKITPLINAVRSSHEDIVRILLEYGADVNAKICKGGWSVGESALHIASTIGNENIVRVLLEHGANVNTVSTNIINNIVMSTPLGRAVENNHENIVRMLLEHGANVNVEMANTYIKINQIVELKTALDIAHEKGNSTIINLLEQAGDR